MFPRRIATDLTVDPVEFRTSPPTNGRRMPKAAAIKPMEKPPSPRRLEHIARGRASRNAGPMPTRDVADVSQQDRKSWLNASSALMIAV
jgi:hypothetical protein